jgi:hypothetical protein
MLTSFVAIAEDTATRGRTGNYRNVLVLLTVQQDMGRAPVVEVVEAVAEAKGMEPEDLEYPLESYIDTEALRLLTAHSSTSWTLSFELPEHEVTVTGEGVIEVDGKRGEKFRPEALTRES